MDRQNTELARLRSPGTAPVAFDVEAQPENTEPPGPSMFDRIAEQVSRLGVKLGGAVCAGVGHGLSIPFLSGFGTLAFVASCCATLAKMAEERAAGIVPPDPCPNLAWHPPYVEVDDFSRVRCAGASLTVIAYLVSAEVSSLFKDRY